MKCPFCGFLDTKVNDSRPTDDNMSIRRRRACPKCNKRFTTYERYESVDLTVVKKDMTREPFDRRKIFKGMLRSCEKRPVSVEALDKATDEITQLLYQSNEKEISTEEIGNLVMDKLKELDTVAYVRFASVYREFQDVSSFYDELENLKK